MNFNKKGFGEVGNLISIASPTGTLFLLRQRQITKLFMESFLSLEMKKALSFDKALNGGR
ncbi:hypothetical protein [Vibrio mediterranei]|uniref:hypothetical protein n=1 Tax=Vibrio mediterranei TaxID=689 RepID=UPI00148C568A|nr:hypothetical protein [Vibrio mediterranei]NOH31302.1 hypothetical protein [Vibrio mediterranei]